MTKTNLILIIALIGLVIALILNRGCGSLNPSREGIDVELLYDSIKRVIVSELPPPDTVFEINETEVALRITDIEELEEQYHAQLINELPERFIQNIDIE